MNSLFRSPLLRLISNSKFQSWASRFPLTRSAARRDGAEIFGLVQGFVESQALRALVELRVLHHLRAGAADAETLGGLVEVPTDRMAVLLQAGAAMGLLKRRRRNRFALARKGAALLGVPGLEAMIQHHGALYRDLADPVALLRERDDTELARFWPYVFGAGMAEDPAQSAIYSDLMAQSQRMVAQDTLDLVRLQGRERLLDVGGGTGVFLTEVARRYKSLELELFDLPAVEEFATRSLAQSGLQDRIAFRAGSFRDDPLPEGADTISLVRVLYDHADETVAALLAKAFAALPPGGMLIVSEPMSGGARPDPITDVYFAFYTMAMLSGRTRSPEHIQTLLSDAGFERISRAKKRRSFVTSVITAAKPD